MTKNQDTACLAKYIACGMVIGSAIGTAAAIMITTKVKKPGGFKEKALNAVDTMGTVMHNIANMAR